MWLYACARENSKVMRRMDRRRDLQVSDRRQRRFKHRRRGESSNRPALRALQVLEGHFSGAVFAQPDSIFSRTWRAVENGDFSNWAEEVFPTAAVTFIVASGGGIEDDAP